MSHFFLCVVGRWPCFVPWLMDGTSATQWSATILPCASRCPTKEANYFLLWGVTILFIIARALYIFGRKIIAHRKSTRSTNNTGAGAGPWAMG